MRSRVFDYRVFVSVEEFLKDIREYIYIYVYWCVISIIYVFSCVCVFRNVVHLQRHRKEDVDYDDSKRTFGSNVHPNTGIPRVRAMPLHPKP